MEPTASAARFHVVFNVGGRRASFEVESDSGVNPIRLPELERFTCPPG
jgi:type VI secretion system protein ImpL